MAMKEIHKQIVSGLAASACLGVFSFGTTATFGVNLLISAIIGFGTYLLIPHPIDPRDIKLAVDVSQAQLNDALEHIDAYITAFDEQMRRSREKWLQEANRSILIVLKNIAAKLQQDPKDLTMPSTTLFMDQYIPRSYFLMKDYVRLWNHATEPAMRANLAPTQPTTERIITGYNTFYRQCLLDGIVDLKVGNEYLKRVLETDLASYGQTQEGEDSGDAPSQPAGSAAGR